MSDQLPQPPQPPQPSPEKQTAIPEVSEPEVVIDEAFKQEYDKFISHNRYRNTIQIQGTKLIDNFIAATPFMDEMHARVLREAYRRMNDYGDNISRTTHLQIAAILKRYLPRIEDGDKGLHGRVVEALAEAEKVEVLAKHMVDEIARQRSQGNIKFVKVLDAAANGRR